jgi:glycine cleavage system protein P-like pyridoxal-binding family
MKIDKEKIFRLFEDKNIENTIKMVDINPKYKKIGMFTKLILNHYIFHSKLEKFLQKEQPEYDMVSTKEASEYIIFNRAWGFIKDIDPEDKVDISCILEFNSNYLNKSLNDSIFYFQEYEEYEKCSHLFKIQQVIKNNVPTQNSLCNLET